MADIQKKDVSESDASSKEQSFFVRLMVGMSIFILLFQWIHNSGSSTSETRKTPTTTTTSITTSTSTTSTTSPNVCEKFGITEDTPYVIHFVQDGESWASIVDTYGLSKYGFTYVHLAEYNGTHYTTMLYTGNTVKVPLLD